MPELPEVETTLRGIKPHIVGKKVLTINIRHPKLRWPIPPLLGDYLIGKKVLQVTRRGKYLLLAFSHGTLIIHLGMSGSLRVLSTATPAKKHDHLDIVFSGNQCLRFTDPRRFGAVLWTPDDPAEHSLLTHIGPEPLSSGFNGDYLWQQAHGKKASVKSFIMDSRIVAGVGNIYATEALFAAGIHPGKSAGKVSQVKYQDLSAAIKAILTKAIKKGGTTLKDFTQTDGSPGYFSIELKAYGRGGKPCLRCHASLKMTRMGQRSTVFCKQCQK